MIVKKHKKRPSQPSQEGALFDSILVGIVALMALATMAYSFSMPPEPTAPTTALTTGACI